MDESSRRRMTLSVSFRPAHMFLNSLMAMATMASTAVLIVKNGGIQVLATSQDRTVKSSLVMEASTTSSLSSNRYAIQFDLRNWIRLLRNPVYQQLMASIRIFKNSDSSDLQCTVGNGSVPFKLSEATFVQENGIDIGSLTAHGVSVALARECFQEVLTKCAQRYANVMLRVYNDRVAFHTVSNTLTYKVEDGNCIIRGVEPGTCQYMMIEWRYAITLNSVSGLSSDVLMCPLTDPSFDEWILFSFRVDDSNFFAFMMQGSSIEWWHFLQGKSFSE